MSDNVIFFPGYLFVDGHYVHHCRKYKTIHDLVDDISHKDYQLSLAWDVRRASEPKGGAKQQGGAA
jgi:hypothetical protein